MSEITPEPGQVNFVEWLENLRVDVAQTVGGVLLRGARPVAIGSTIGATTKPTSSAGSLVGYAIRNLDDAGPLNVHILLRDGGDTNADVILPITLAPGESARDWFGPGGIHLSRGLFIDIAKDDGSAGLVDGCVFLRGSD